MVLLLWIIYVVSVLCLICLCARLLICALCSPAWKGLTSWLSFVVTYCEFVTFPLVAWVRCGTWLDRFLIFTPTLTLKVSKRWKSTKNKQKWKQYSIWNDLQSWNSLNRQTCYMYIWYKCTQNVQWNDNTVLVWYLEKKRWNVFNSWSIRELKTQTL